MPTHMAELGSGNFEQELTLSLLGCKEDALDQIEAAITRIEDGSFGRCKTCGVKIHKSRLQAIPYAAQCVRCASELEPIDFRIGRRILQFLTIDRPALIRGTLFATDFSMLDKSLNENQVFSFHMNIWFA
jgi:RNA polymerase-binding transcription factor DksA